MCSKWSPVQRLLLNISVQMGAVVANIALPMANSAFLKEDIAALASVILGKHLVELLDNYLSCRKICPQKMIT